MLPLLLLCVLMAAPVQAATFWDDEMESGNTGYTLPAGGMSYDTSVKYSGSGSTRYDFSASCYPDSSAQANCGGFMDRSFTATGTLFRRFYMRLSAGFTVSDIFTKLMRSDTYGIVSNWWTLGCCGSRTMEVHDQNVPVGDTTIYYTSWQAGDATWYCVETEETLNTPGVANGVARAWVDGVQVLNVTNIPYRAAGDNSLFNNNRLYRQTGLGSIWFDRVAVGDTRIGCIGAAPAADTTPPSPPTGVTVQ